MADDNPSTPEMIERVARALTTYEVHAHLGDPPTRFYIVRKDDLSVIKTINNGGYYAHLECNLLNARAAIAAMREPIEAMVDAAAWQSAIRATQGLISPAKWETMPDDHRNEWECKNFWRTVATHAVKAAIDAALGEQH